MIKKQKFAPKNVWKLHKDSILTLHAVVTGQERMLYSCSKEGCVRILDLKQQNIHNTLTLSRNGPNAHKQAQFVHSAELQKLGLENTDKVEKIEDLTAVTFTENGVYGGYENGDIYCWNLKDGEVKSQLFGHTKSITQLLPISIKVLVSASEDKTIRCWNMITGACEHVLKVGSSINHMLKDKKILYVLVEHSSILMLDSETYQLINSFPFKDKAVTTFTIKDKTLFAAITNCKIEVFNIKDDGLEPGYVLEGHKDWIICMKIYENHLYTGADDKTIKVWSLDQQRMLEEFTDHEDGVVCMEFCNGIMYSGSYDHNIRFWEIEEMFDRMRERRIMKREDLASKKYDAYYKVMYKGQRMVAKSPVKK